MNCGDSRRSGLMEQPFGVRIFWFFGGRLHLIDGGHERRDRRFGHRSGQGHLWSSLAADVLNDEAIGGVCGSYCGAVLPSA